jgi:fructose/tagatose bisphosphate aldolase
MFDGSTLPLEENLRVSAERLERCRELSIVLEVECGVVGGEEDGIGGEGVSRDRLYTTQADLLRVADVLGTGGRGRYLLAATFGNMHGLYAPGRVELRPQILADGQEALEVAHSGARFQYVFHGSSGSSLEELRAAVDNGVVKVNLDSETQYALTRAAAEHMLDHRDGVVAPEPALADKRAYDPLPGAPRPRALWPSEWRRPASSSARRDAASRRDQETATMSGSRRGHGSCAISSRKARASGDQAERVKAPSSRARGGSRLRTEARRGPTTIFEGTSAGPRPAAASAATPAI